MPYYHQLFAANGGGIALNDHATEADLHAVNVFIGLGNTGITVLKETRTKITGRIRGSGETPAQYRNIHFLGLDTCPREGLEPHMFLSLAHPHPEQLPAADFPKQPSALNWLDPETFQISGDARNGAGSRQLDRLLFLHRSPVFYRWITELIRLVENTDPQPVHFHIFTDLCDDMNGCFLDVCYLIRHAAENAASCSITGYCILPELALVPVPHTDLVSRRLILRNGHAAMQELDFSMNLPANGGSMTQIYPGDLNIPWDRAPMDLCYLVGKPTDRPDTPPVLTAAIDRIAETAVTYMHADRLRLQMQALQDLPPAQNGALHRYCTLGAETALLPMDQILTRLSAMLMMEYASVQHHSPSEEDTARVLDMLLPGGLNGLHRHLCKKDVPDLMDYTDDYQAVLREGTLPITTWYQNQAQAITNKLRKAADPLLNPDDSDSLYRRIRVVLDPICLDLNRGPMYVRHLLSSTSGKDLLTTTENMIHRLQEVWEQKTQFRSELQGKNQQLKEIFFGRIRRRLFEPDAPRYLEYRDSLRNLTECEIELACFPVMDTLLRHLQSLLIRLLNDLYDPLTQILNRLFTTARLNLEYHPAPDGISMETLEGMQEELAAEIQTCNLSVLWQVLLAKLGLIPSEPSPAKDSDIPGIFNTFITDFAFPHYSHRYLKDYFRKHSSNPESVYTQLVRILKQNSMIYAGPDDTVSSETRSILFCDPGEAFFCTFPDLDIHQDDCWQKGRVTLIQTQTGLPMYAFPDWSACQREGCIENIPGRYILLRHLLPPVHPVSQPDAQAPAQIQQWTEEVRQLFLNAARAGLIDAEGNIRTPNGEILDSIPIPPIPDDRLRLTLLLDRFALSATRQQLVRKLLNAPETD